MHLKGRLFSAYLSGLDTATTVYGLLKMQAKGGFDNGSGITPYQSLAEGNQTIHRLLLGHDPVLIARHGTYELRGLVNYAYGQVPGDLLTDDGVLEDDRVLKRLHLNAGVFPNDLKVLSEFGERYGAAARSVDCLGAFSFKNGAFKWEEMIFQDYHPHAQLIDIEAIDFFRFERPWTRALEGQKVLVIHPLAETILDQYAKREDIFENPLMLPEFDSLATIKAVQSIAGNPTPFDSWLDALDFMCEQIDRAEFDVAIVGAGAYGMPLAAYAKSIGKKAIHMGGVTQILFGIMGGRWEEKCRHLVTDAWTRPPEKERPRNYETIEDGCYW